MVVESQHRHHSTSDATKKDQGLSDPKVAVVGSASEEGAKAGTGGSGESNQGDTAKKESDLMDEVTTLLRSLRAAVRVCSIKRISKDDEEMVLLDGGATHCHRSCESEAEWSSAVDIKVTLAEGETLMKQLPDARTLLTKERVQPIVPVSMVATLGYKISWTSDGCRIHHPERGNLPITMVQGCPTVPSRIGRSLMKEIEEWHKQQCRVRSILAGEEEGTSLLHHRLESLRTWETIRPPKPNPYATRPSFSKRRASEKNRAIWAIFTVFTVFTFFHFHGLTFMWLTALSSEKMTYVYITTMEHL